MRFTRGVLVATMVSALLAGQLQPAHAGGSRSGMIPANSYQATTAVLFNATACNPPEGMYVDGYAVDVGHATVLSARGRSSVLDYSLDLWVYAGSHGGCRLVSTYQSINPDEIDIRPPEPVSIVVVVARAGFNVEFDLTWS